jgi:radical SAM/Cys-rich protein
MVLVPVNRADRGGISSAIPAFGEKMRKACGGPLTAADVLTLQVNLGYRCNMSCKHCHVEAGPARGEAMNEDTVNAVLAALQSSRMGTLDITGGAPELNPLFGYLVEKTTKAGCHVVVRTNLTVFFEEGMDYLPEFLSSHNVEIIASVPHYTEKDVDRVRGRGAFEKSIRALQRLNSLGYGKTIEKKLSLVYTPGGTFLSPSQKTLEEDYRKELGGSFDISFDALYTFTNMPLGRFRQFLERTGGLEKYMEKLACAFNPEAITGLMCRHLISVGWDGRLYDCDFNQLLRLGVESGRPQDIREFDLSRLSGRKITVGEHCYACTAGQGST